MKFSKIGEEEAARLSSELKALGLSDLEVAQIVNCMPTSSEEVRVILLSERKFVGSSLLEEVCKVLEKYKR
jgi:DNA-directed RNA polymerase subunit F